VLNNDQFSYRVSSPKKILKSSPPLLFTHFPAKVPYQHEYQHSLQLPLSQTGLRPYPQPAAAHHQYLHSQTLLPSSKYLQKSASPSHQKKREIEGTFDTIARPILPKVLQIRIFNPPPRLIIIRIALLLHRIHSLHSFFFLFLSFQLQLVQFGK
jgi:hypothetical protein